MDSTRELSGSTAAPTAKQANDRDLTDWNVGDVTFSGEALRKLRRYRLYNYLEAMTAALERAERAGRNVVLAEDMQRVKRPLSRRQA